MKIELPPLPDPFHALLDGSPFDYFNADDMLSFRAEGIRLALEAAAQLAEQACSDYRRQAHGTLSGKYDYKADALSDFARVLSDLASPSIRGSLKGQA